MNENEVLSEVQKFAKQNSKQDDIHGFAHVMRVYNICLEIGKQTKANMLVLKIAALLHDIGRIFEEKDALKRNHAEISAEMTKSFLTSSDFNLSQIDIINIVHSIRAHSFSNKVVPETLEAKILSDADKLDAIGAIGLYRTIGFTIKNRGNLDAVIEHLENKILKLKDLMQLDVSRKIANRRQKIVCEFYDKINKEK